MCQYYVLPNRRTDEKAPQVPSPSSLQSSYISRKQMAGSKQTTGKEEKIKKGGFCQQEEAWW